MTLLSKMSWSLRLDYEFIFLIPDILILQKISFVLRKYQIFLKNKITGFSSPGSTTVFGRKYYFNEIYGLASLQRVYCASFKLKQLLPANPVVVDVGANIGQFNFFCGHYLQAKRVLSMEPVKSCHDLLELNSANSTDCFNYLVSSESGEQEFYLSSESSQLGSCIKDNAGSYAKCHLRPGKKLDDILAECGGLAVIDLLKIDTEGSEFDVLVSGEQTLSKTGAVLVEMSVFRPSRGNIFQVGSFLEERGFRLDILLGADEIRPKDIDGLFIRR